MRMKFSTLWSHTCCQLMSCFLFYCSFKEFKVHRLYVARLSDRVVSRKWAALTRQPSPANQLLLPVADRLVVFHQFFQSSIDCGLCVWEAPTLWHCGERQKNTESWAAPLTFFFFYCSCFVTVKGGGLGKKTPFEEFVRLFFFFFSLGARQGFGSLLMVILSHLELGLNKEVTLNTVKVTSSGLTRPTRPSLS